MTVRKLQQKKNCSKIFFIITDDFSFIVENRISTYATLKFTAITAEKIIPQELSNALNAEINSCVQSPLLGNNKSMLSRSFGGSETQRWGDAGDAEGLEMGRESL